MRPQPILLRLGDAEWRLRPLTLMQIQEIEPLLQGQDAIAGHSIEAAIKIIGVALSRDHAESAARLKEMEATAPEIGAAMRAVLRLGGFIAASDEQEPGAQEPEKLMPGEAAAGADGSSSTPA